MDIDRLMEKAKNARMARFDTNCYTADAISKAETVWELDDSFIFSYSDHGVKRLCFFASSEAVLGELLKLPSDGPYYLEIMTREPDQLRIPGAECIARLMRLSNSDCNSAFHNEELNRYRDDTIGQVADVSDTHEINELLWSVFKTEVSHLLNDEELEKVIADGRVTIHRSDKIDAVLQLEVMPKKFYINQVVNRTKKDVIHAMMLQRLDQYRQNGGKYMYAWVEERNTASLKFHSKYGMEHDGMWNVVYCLK